MKLFAAGIATESNTFCPIPTGLSDFLVQRGKDVLAGRVDYPSFNLSKTWGVQAQARGDEFVFSLMAWAPPGGVTVASAYESLRDEILSDLREAMPVDGVLLMLHGAMVAQGCEDCEEDLIRHVRAIVGQHAVVAVELDLHCHLHEAKIAAADIVITYKEYPHIDINDRARELFELTVATKFGRIRPTMALFDCRMVGSYPTSREPLRSFVDATIAAERDEGVLSISFAHGFRCADLPHVGAKMLVVTDNDPALAQRLALEFGLRVYGMRREIGFESVSLPMEQALSRAMASKRTPIVIADQSDNVGGGAPGDATYALRWLLDHQAEDVAMAIFYDPEVVRIVSRAGRGASLPVRLGGKLGRSSGDPVDLNVCVLAIAERYSHLWPQQSGEAIAHPAGTVAALRGGGVELIVSSERCQCFSPSIFEDLGVDPRRKRLLVVKSNQHFHDAFAKIAAEVIYMAAPGAVPTDPRQIAYSRLDRSRLYPWVEDPLRTSGACT